MKTGTKKRPNYLSWAMKGGGGREGVAYNINPIQDLVIRMSNIILARFFCL